MVRHILIAAPPNGIAARAATGERARALVAELQRNPSRFAELAERSSDCPSRATGGCLGQIGPGQTVPEFERALGRLPVGEVAPAPVESRYGFHVVRVDQRIEGRDLPYELVRERIAAWLAEKARRTAIKQYLSILAGRADIRGVELAAASSPLVQ
jgi:peptidyl-prolyl cis-trans isomerase C